MRALVRAVPPAWSSPTHSHTYHPSPHSHTPSLLHCPPPRTGARVKVFDHNQPAHLEALLRSAIAEGQPRTGRPWKKVIVVVEGIYSMEGEMARLAEIVAIKKKYKVR